MSSRLLERQEKMYEEVEKFLVEGKHYSHDHPLSLREDKEEDDDLCGICGVPILSSPSYNCTTLNCRFLLHQQCAVKLASTLIYSTHGPDYFGHHTLQMRKRSPSSSSSSSSSSSPNYTYKCEYCEFETHPLSAVVGGGGIEIKIKHRSHPEHPLVAVCRETVSLCDACGRKQKGFFFTCNQLCNFWIHQDCTILPSVVMLPSHPQPYILTYSSPNPLTSIHCIVCCKYMPPRVNGVYFCPHSTTFAHIACATNKPAQHETTKLELVQLPDEEWDTFPSMAIRIYAASGTTQLGPDDYYHEIKKESYILSNPNTEEKADKNMTIEKYHKQHHPLILTTTITTTPTPHDDDDDVSSACDLCTQPIHSSSPFHRCCQCPFVAHEICADILPNIHKFFIPYGPAVLRTELYPDPGKVFFNSVFYCSSCRRPCNGLCSYTHFRITKCIDLECLAAPITVTHASHPNPHHLLFRTHLDPSGTPPLACCSADTIYFYDVYRCIVCNYSVHISCAMLPQRVRFPQYHRPHPLFLIYNASTTSTTAAVDVDYDFCEVCEEGIDLRYWLYRCVECDESYHVNCIPSLGYLSKVKFGGKLILPSYVHDHPLTLTRMLTLPSQRCGAGDCKQIIHGMVDEMAFFCSLCHFWLHFSCARNSALAHTSDPLWLYYDVRQQLWIKPTQTSSYLMSYAMHY